MKKKISTVVVRRKREKKTDYKKRRHLLLNKNPRLVIRKSLRVLSAQLIRYGPTGDKVIATASSQELKKYGWGAHSGNIPAAYLTGLLLAKRAKEKKVTNAVLDLGLQAPVKCARLFAAVKGCLDGGLKVPVGESIASEERIKGAHIVSYKENKDAQSKFQFTTYTKNKVDPAKISDLVEEVKKKILA